MGRTCGECKLFTKLGDGTHGIIGTCKNKDILCTSRYAHWEPNNSHCFMPRRETIQGLLDRHLETLHERGVDGVREDSINGASCFAEAIRMAGDRRMGDYLDGAMEAWGCPGPAVDWAPARKER